jgi:hypothetical protein
MIRAFLAIAAACITMPALAQVPDYDTARRCSEFAKGSQTIENECRRDEADARRELERSRISQEVWATCNEQVRAEQSYLRLFGCILNEAEARTNQRQAAPIPVAPTNAPIPATPMHVPTSNAGVGSRPAPLAAHPGSVTVMRGSQTTIEKPSGR